MLPHVRSLLAPLAAGLFVAPVLASQERAPFPLIQDGEYGATGTSLLRPAHDRIGALVGKDHVVLTGAPLGGGALGDLALTRIRHENLGFGYEVDGVPAPGLLDGVELSIWKGSVAGDPESEVLLSFSRFGSRGWIRTGGELLHLLPQPDEQGSFVDGYSILASERDLARLGVEADLTCHADELGELERFELDGLPSGVPSGGELKGGSGEIYGCAMAIETDYQLNQVFGGSLPAETAYVTTLWAAVSDRYLEQVKTVLTFPYVQFYTTPADPWSTPDFDGSSSAMLDEFLNAWSGSIPGGARLGHFVSGADLGGGIAYLSVLCDSSQSFSFAVSGNVDGSTPFPIAVSPLNWDFMVTAHETGHNFGSPHTHDFNPPIDQCAFGVCITDGTLMSYCHLCPGGLLNVTTFFHPLCVDVMEAHLQGCLDLIVGIDALPPAFVAPGVPTPLTAHIEGSPVGSVTMSYRFDSGSSFTAIPMTPIGGGSYSADLPAPACDDDPEFFFGFTDALAGAVQSETFTAEVGTLSMLFHDDFQTSQGWTVGVPSDDATSGIWERNDPIGTGAQPSAGIEIGGGAFCFFTGQGSIGGGLGENDVDGGKTTLVSPAFDLSGGSARIGYWRWYSNNQGATPGTDVLEVEVSNDGTTWVDVETVGPSGPETEGGWFYHEFDVASLVAPTATVRVRFVASDEGEGSLVEAAVDEVSVFRVSCDVCQPDLGFGGPGTATLSLCGDVLSPGGSAQLLIDNAPASVPAFVGFSIFFNPTPALGGTLVPVPVAGVVGLTTNGAGQASFTVSGGAASPGTVYLQAIVLNGGQFLITNAIGAQFVP